MLEITGLTQKFGGKVVFKDVTVTFEDGKIYGLVGPNGIGKSVFFKTISGLISPTSGQVKCNGKIIGKDVDYIENLGYMDSDINFVGYLNGFENLKLLAAIKNMIGKDTIRALMQDFGLDPDDKTTVKNYSLGMRQKLAIIQAVMEDPSVIIFDEPFNGLDKDSCKFVKDYILKLKGDNKIILLTSHILNDIEEVADVAYEFNDQNITLVQR